MNYRVITGTIGRIMLVIGVSMLFPLIVAFIYREGATTKLAFFLSSLITCVLGIFLTITMPKNKEIHAKEAIIIVGLSWFIISLVGCIPFILSKEIPSFVDAFFETVSGFSTTGMSTQVDVERLSKSVLFWRSENHFLGGMGVLVFIVAFLPNANASSLNLIRSESPGPQVSKLVSKVKLTAEILYIIYVAMTLLLIILLSFSKIGWFDSIVTAFGAAGTGGFSVKNASIQGYNSCYVEVLLTVFILLFGMNFNIYYLILIGKFRSALKNEEFIVYVSVIFVSIAIIVANSFSLFGNFWTALRYSSFQVASIITTTGYTSMDINKLPMLSKAILMFLMFLGACSGSTAGGVKVSRFIIVTKAARARTRNVVNPRVVSIVKLDGKKVDENIINETCAFFLIYFLFLILTVFTISASGYNLETSLSASLSAIGCIGASFGSAPASFPWFTKLLLSFDMLLGRLEIFPIILLFSPKTWSRMS